MSCLQNTFYTMQLFSTQLLPLHFHSYQFLINHPSLLTSFIFCSFFLILFSFMQWWHHHHHNHKRLPPGSLGWSYLGETLKLYSENPNSFFSNRQKWYGDIFKTHILGCPCVMISSPKAARTVLVTQANLFKPTYPPSKEKLIGQEAIFFQQGACHSMLKKLVQASFLPSTIRNSVSEVEQIVLKLLPTWANRTINTLQEMKRYAFEVASISAFGETNELEMEEIRELYSRLEKGYNSYPLQLPGTSYWKAMKREQQGIKSKLATENRGLSWDDTRHMPFTTRVMEETLRSASIVSFTFREAVRDVEVEGYIIPKGWKVLPLFRTIHHSPHFFPQPYKFDPSRFQVPPRPNTYMPFGNGVHSCPGSELAKLEILLLLHHLTISYRWEVVGNEDGIQYGPFPVPKHGLPLKITLRKKIFT
ncbi:putative (+)-abscisic acid 8'-hydroxylase [Lupinus albus]|uniref:Putative (+)-abscisic acid 8'-hydroxylase n=1 Tax=Lupinus albus TaxID=3870 RepID=A0A6A4QMH0_LUPAL|nr:putative (+)-abscisic acid 8'-hydroxylase [Lupinus albus]